MVSRRSRCRRSQEVSSCGRYFSAMARPSRSRAMRFSTSTPRSRVPAPLVRSASSNSGWDRLQRLLRETIDAARYHLGHTFERVEQDGSDVVVHFAGGRSERADILIGSDGIPSSVRAQVAPAIPPIYSGYYIWPGRPHQADLRPQTRESIFPYFTFFLPQRQQILGYPIAGLNNDLRFGHRRYNFIWYRVGDAQQLREMCVDENGHQHAYSVPPPLIRKDLIPQI